jgi:hypothetical protein
MISGFSQEREATMGVETLVRESDSDVVFRDMGLPKDVDDGIAELASSWDMQPNQVIWNLVRQALLERQQRKQTELRSGASKP